MAGLLGFKSFDQGVEVFGSVWCQAVDGGGGGFRLIGPPITNLSLTPGTVCLSDLFPTTTTATTTACSFN